MALCSIPSGSADTNNPLSATITSTAVTTSDRTTLGLEQLQSSYRGSGRLTGKKAIITGGDSGIGRAVAIAYAREGADVLISYLSEEEDAAQTKRLVEEAGRKDVLLPGSTRR